jgi:16S rRNA (guanine966-N2)-methyltransferase
LISTFGSLEGLHFLDLFAGSGSVGDEALSRGAGLVEAVEENSAAAEVCGKNFGLLLNQPNLGKFKVHNKTTFEYLNHLADKQFEIIFLDPPYEVTNVEIEKILRKIKANNLLSKFGVIAIERDAKGAAFTWPEGLVESKIRSYGQGAIHYGSHAQ